MNRRDWCWGPVHIIKRSYRDPQYGALLWGWNDIGSAGRITLDVWVRRTLWTFRRNRV